MSWAEQRNREPSPVAHMYLERLSFPWNIFDIIINFPEKDSDDYADIISTTIDAMFFSNRIKYCIIFDCTSIIQAISHREQQNDR